MSEISRGAKDSVLQRHEKHKQMQHETQQQEQHIHSRHSVSVTGVYRDALSRQIAEAVKIEKIPECKRINSKQEFHVGKIPRTELTFG